MRIAVLGALLVAVAHCASGVADPAAPPASAKVELISIAPPAGTTVDATTALTAEIKYSIDHFEPATNYYIAPLFASKRGNGNTFNAYDRLDEGTPITTAVGTVTIRYGIARELRSPELARPVRVWFYVLERTSAQTTRVIGKTEAVEFR